MKRKNLWGLLLINFGISAYWQIENFWINLYWNREVDQHAFYISLMVATSAIVGVLTQIIIGALSDSSKNKYGRRKIFIFIGGITGCICMCIFPLTKHILLSYGLIAAVVFGVIIDIFITFFGDMTTPTRLALFTELTEIEERGGKNALIGLLSGAGGGLIMLMYIMNFPNNDAYFYVGAVCLLLGAIGCVFLVDDSPEPNNSRTFQMCLKEILRRESYREHPDFYRLLLAFFVFYLGLNVFSNYIFVYAENVLRFDQTQIGLLAVSFVVFNLLITLPATTLSDKIGRKPLVIIAIACSSILLIVLTFLDAGQTFLLYIITFGLIMALTATFDLTATSWTQDLCPKDMKGSMLAYLVVVKVIPMAPGALLGGWIADHYAVSVGQYSPLIFLVGGLISLCAFPFYFKITDSIKREEKS